MRLFDGRLVILLSLTLADLAFDYVTTITGLLADMNLKTRQIAKSLYYTV